jgi:hypothetical protein
VNKKLVLILTLLALTTIIKACDDNKACEKTNTSCTQSTDQYLFDEAQKTINTNYPEGLEVITRLKHKGFEPAQALYWQIRLFEEKKTQYNRRTQPRGLIEVMMNLKEEGFIPAQSFLEKIERCDMCRTMPDSEDNAKLKIYESLSNEGFALAQWWMGTAFLHGLSGIQQDVNKGVELLSKAAEQQEPSSSFDIGKMYWDGTHGKPKDKREAMKMMRNAGRAWLFLKNHNID